MVGTGGAGCAGGGEEQRHWSRRNQSAPRRGNIKCRDNGHKILYNATNPNIKNVFNVA